MPRFKMTIEYAGTRYSGWQIQKNARTVAGEIDRAVRGATGAAAFELYGAGRTDAGVHALAQVAHLRTRAKTTARDILYGANDRLPPDVNVLAVEPVSAHFHARHDAVLRSYVYQISTRRTAFGKKYVWWVKDALDERAMARAAALIAGRHDFSSFCERPHEPESTLVHVEESRLERHGDLLVYHVAASHFLWRMVRRLTGALVAVGRGKLTQRDVERLLATRSNEVAALTAPPSGLFLEQVLYSADEPRRRPAPAFPVPKP
jgi:tRNA pseudouridine38-40 synthase